MLRSGAEMIFTGDTGVVTYLLLAAMLAIAAVGRSASMKRFRYSGSLRGMAGGFLLIVLSRIVFVSNISFEKGFYSFLAALTALAGLYLLLTCMISGRRMGDYGLWNSRIAFPALLAGTVLGSLLMLLVVRRAAGAGFLPAVLSFTAMMPAGLIAGLFLEKDRMLEGRQFIPAASAVMTAAATSMMSMMAPSVFGAGSFGIQLFALTDLAGLILFLAAYAPEPQEGWDKVPGGSHDFAGDSELSIRNLLESVASAGAGMMEISMKIIGGERAQSIYKMITSAIAGETKAGFVLIRMLRETDGRFENRGFSLEGEIGPQAHFNMELKKSWCTKIFEGTKEVGETVRLTRKDLGEDTDAFVPNGVDLGDGCILAVPVRFGGILAGFITAGVFGSEMAEDVPKVLRAYAHNLLELTAREKFKEKIKEKEKTLVGCREELEKANKLKSNFLSIVSHELRTPLTSIKAYSETLLDGVMTIERDTIKNFLKVMGEENDRIIKLVDNILNYSSMETGHLKVEKRSCNLSEVITGVFDSLEGSFRNGKVNSELKLPKSDVVIDADPELIGQLAHNLMSNAVKFTPPMGSVSVSLEEEASAARIVVQDTGRGIPEDQLEKIFERFHQVDASDTREHGGSGLGLAICKNIVDWHDGRIWVENVKEAGAKFVVMLPMKDIVVRQPSGDGYVGSVRFERERYLSLLVEMLSEFLQAKKASIMVLDGDNKALRIVAAKGLDAEFVQNTRVELGERIAGRVFLEGESVHVFNIEKDGKIGRTNNSAYYWTSSFISSPLRDGGDVIGVLNVSDHVEGREFTHTDREILEAFSGIISRMLKKLDAFEKVSCNFDKLKEAMKSILHVREEWGSKNLLNYTLIALAVGRRMGLEEESMTALRMGMNMYDLGMMKIQRNIRVKKEELTGKERRRLKEHSNLGFSLLSPMGLDERIMKAVRYHHEYWDGSGYPEGLVKEEIPVEARIINVVDSFRALITQGPYRRCYTIDEARNEIIRNSGTNFDPKVVGAFVKSLHELDAREIEGDLVLLAMERELEEIRKEYQNNDKETVKEEVQ